MLCCARLFWLCPPARCSAPQQWRQVPRSLFHSARRPCLVSAVLLPCPASVVLLPVLAVLALAPVVLLTLAPAVLLASRPVVLALPRRVSRLAPAAPALLVAPAPAMRTPDPAAMAVMATGGGATASMRTATAVRPPTNATTPTVEAGASWFATSNDNAAVPRFAWTGVRLDRRLEVARANNFHPEFGYFCPMPRARHELRVVLRSLLLGMLIGAVLVAIRAGEAREHDNAAANAQPEPSKFNTLMPDVREPSSGSNNPAAGKVDLNSAIKPYPMRMVRVRSTKPGVSVVGEQR